ncbi:MAG: dephospho-CoA kinase [Chloroflexi bacterium]|nr:dephospho-CoA kinase [Chloroflexota bacterium]
MKSLGITGNIGSGKSTVLKFLKEMGNTTYDLDEIAKNFYTTDTNIKNKVLEIFPHVKSKDDEIDTNKLGQTVFNNPEKLKILQEIIWPAVEKYIFNKIENTSKLIIFEGALIIEAGWHKLFDFIWIVDSKVELSKIRVLKNRNLSENHFETILNYQNDINEMVKKLNKDNISYLIISNNSELNSLKKVTQKEFINLNE